MSIITKEIARSVSFKMTEIKREELKIIDKTISEAVYLIMKSKIPKNIFEFYQENIGYFKKFDSVNFIGNGLNHEYFSFSPDLPTTNECRNTVSLDEKQALKIIELYNKRNKLRKEIDCLSYEIQTALLSLRTYNKCSTEFKEAYIFLPKKVTQELIVNIDKIRAKL